jgi:hypothetical protein
MAGKASWSDLDTLEVMFRFETLNETGAQVAVAMGASRSAILGLAHRMRSAAAELAAQPMRDGALLTLVDGILLHHQSAERLAARHGLSRNAVLRAVWVVMNDAALAGPSQTRQANGDLVVWPKWWRPVPAAQGRVA